jgi:hypothetical protein
MVRVARPRCGGNAHAAAGTLHATAPSALMALWELCHANHIRRLCVGAHAVGSAERVRPRHVEHAAGPNRHAAGRHRDHADPGHAVGIGRQPLSRRGG